MMPISCLEDLYAGDDDFDDFNDFNDFNDCDFNDDDIDARNLPTR